MQIYGYSTTLQSRVYAHTYAYAIFYQQTINKLPYSHLQREPAQHSDGAEKAGLCVLRDGVVTRDSVNGRGPRAMRVGGMSAKREPVPEHTLPALRRAEATLSATEERSDIQRVDEIVHEIAMPDRKITAAVTMQARMLIETHGRITAVDIQLDPASTGTRSRQSRPDMAKKSRAYPLPLKLRQHIQFLQMIQRPAIIRRTIQLI